MKQILTTLIFIAGILSMPACAQKDSVPKGKVASLSKQQFMEKVMDYESNPGEWKYLGTRPCVIDFTATWCGPCRKMAPILEELAEQYAGKVDFYKIDIDAEPELAAVFGVSAVPALLFCPMNGTPKGAMGAQPKKELEKAIQKLLLPATKDK